MRMVFCTGAVVIGLLVSQAQAVVIWDEGVDADISDDRLNPDSAALALGSNELIATSVSGDREYITLNVPGGTVLSKIVLNAYAGLDQTAFIGVQSGTTLTEPPTGTDVTQLLGYSHFGPNIAPVGTDYMSAISTGAGSMGFTPPLPSGDYTFWMQQTGGNAATYEWDFVVIPEPTTLGLLLISGAAMMRRR